MKKLMTLMVLVAMIAFQAGAQIVKPVKWQITSKKIGDGLYEIKAVATITSGWHLYDTKLPEDGPLPTTFNIDDDESTGIEKVGEFTATTKAKIEKSEAFNMDLKYFETTATFVQKIKVTGTKGKLVGYVEFMACSGGQCVPPSEAEFEFELTK